MLEIQTWKPQILKCSIGINAKLCFDSETTQSEASGHL